MKEKPVVGWAMPTLLQKCEFVFGRPEGENISQSSPPSSPSPSSPSQKDQLLMTTPSQGCHNA